MKLPRFELTRVYEDGSREPPQVFPVTKLPWETKTDRRSFLGAAVMAGTVLAATSCAELARTVAKIGASAKTFPCRCPEDACAHENRVEVLVISPDGKLLISRGGGLVKLWSLPDGALVKTLEGHRGRIAISPNGKLLISGNNDKIIKLWNLPDGKPIKTLEGRGDEVRTLAISPDGKLLASGNAFGSIRL